MKGPKALLESENNLVTEMGAWFPGERVVFRGKDLHHDLGDMSWMELFFFGITGRQFSSAELKIIASIWVYTSFPDPRLWNNRVAALAGTARSTANLGMSAAIAVSEASIYGRRLDVSAQDFLLRARLALDMGEDLSDFVKRNLKKYRRIPGFGRPVSKDDERIEHFLRLVDEVWKQDGKYLQLVLDIDRVLLEGGWRMRMNYAALTAAFAADIGLDSRQYPLFGLLAFVAGMPPCFIDQETKAEGTFVPIRCETICYEGAEARDW